MGTPRRPKKPAWSITISDPVKKARNSPLAPNPNTQEYIEATIRRLSIFSDMDLKSDNEISSALGKYGFALANRQRESMRLWLIKRAARRAQKNTA